MNILSRSGTDFFLTGGTALSRGYYNHRYSDDLDFFLDRSETYHEQVDEVLKRLRAGGLVWDVQEKFVRAQDFTTLTVGYDESELMLKLDFVNDKVPHFGGIHKTDLFYRTDSVRNILSNKLSAMFRYAAKDVADIWAIAKRETIDWVEIIREAKQKEAGLEVHYICEILKGMPREKFDAVAWTVKPDWREFRDGIDRIVLGMLGE